MFVWLGVQRALAGDVGGLIGTHGTQFGAGGLADPPGRLPDAELWRVYERGGRELAFRGDPSVALWRARRTLLRCWDDEAAPSRVRVRPALPHPLGPRPARVTGTASPLVQSCVSAAVEADMFERVWTWGVKSGGYTPAPYELKYTPRAAGPHDDVTRP